MTQVALKNIYQSIPHLLALPSKHSWIDYDEEADVLYLSFEKPQSASDSEINEDDVIIRKKDGQVIGLTILHASQRN
jgi:uncharacterized protein YuzE